MFYGIFKGIDKDSKVNDSKNIILFLIVKLGVKKIGGVCIYRNNICWEVIMY